MLAAATALEPYYRHSTANAAICLYRGGIPVHNASSGEAARFDGRVVLNWKPQPEMVVEVWGPLAGAAARVLMPGTEMSASSPTFTKHLPSQRSMRRLPYRAGIHATAPVEAPRVGLIGDPAQSIVMHGVNLSKVFTKVLVAAGSTVVPQRMDLRGGGWAITVDPAPQGEALQRQLLVEGGYAITHTLVATKTRGEPTTLPEAEGLREALSLFYQFAYGRSIGIVLPVGLHPSGKAIWTSWQLPYLQPLYSVWAWVGYENGAELESMWPNFIALWSDPYWELTLRLAIGYYVIANRPIPVNLAIGTAHMVLDMLAFAVLVEDRQILSKSGFEHRSATENLRQLLSALAIPTTIPPDLTHLAGLQIGGHLADGPAAVSKLRNEVAHLRRSASIMPTTFLVDVWRLAMWYVEMILFRLLDFHGAYRSRLTWELEPVP